MNKIVLDIENYKHANEKNDFIKDISLEVYGGKISFLIGISGSGKSTLMEILLNIHSGFFNGKCNYYLNNKISAIRELQRLGHIGYMTHEPALISWRKVYENLKVPSFLNENLDMPKQEYIVHLLESVGLQKDILTKYPNELSFGMQMRVSLVRILLYKPNFIFLDEFFTGIDSVNKTIIYKSLKKYISENNSICFAITHAIDEVLNKDDDIYVLTNTTKKILKIKSNIGKQNFLKILAQ